MPISQYRGKWHYVRSFDLLGDQRSAQTLCGAKNIRRLLVARRGTDAPKTATCKRCLRAAEYYHNRYEFGQF